VLGLCCKEIPFDTCFGNAVVILLKTYSFGKRYENNLKAGLSQEKYGLRTFSNVLL
jgi:hypothetical protein